MSTIVDRAKEELKRSGWYSKDSDYGGMIPDAVIELLETFAKQGHSGNSARIVSKMFHRLANFESLTPLTFFNDEWDKVSKGFYQNKRVSSFFKDDKGVYFMDSYSAITHKRKSFGIEDIEVNENPSSWGAKLYEMQDGILTGRAFSKTYLKDSDVESRSYKPIDAIGIKVTEVEYDKDDWLMACEIDDKEYTKLRSIYKIDYIYYSVLAGVNITHVDKKLMDKI